MVDFYLETLVAHKPSLVFISFNAEFVENIKATKVGDGFWQTASAVPTTFKVYVIDELDVDAWS